jgi:hypothetical protein
LEYRTTAELVDNPGNWRRHPPQQLRGLKAIVGEVGWAGAALYNERTGRLIDGHARKQIARKGERIPVLVGSWSEADERKILATFDPLVGMAETDGPALQSVLRSVETESDQLRDLIARLEPAPTLHMPGAPESVQENARQMESLAARRRDNQTKSERADTERYLILVFPSAAQKRAELARLGLPGDERYLPAAHYELRALTGSGTYGNAPKSADRRQSGATG